MEIKIHNDAKEKAMSFEATLEDCSISEPMFFGSVEAIGYGLNEDEAKSNLRACLEKISDKLKSFLQENFK